MSTIFWSWQNDFEPAICRHLVKRTLEEAVSEVGKDLGLEDADRPELDHDTKDVPGMVDIVPTILRKITESAVFIADLTPVGTTGTKWLPNPNVMIELGWAMHKPGWERVIGVLNLASGCGIEGLPFDIRQRRILTYSISPSTPAPEKKAAVQQLKRELKAAIQSNLGQHLAQQAAETPVERVAARPSDPSIWDVPKSEFDFQLGGVSYQALLVDAPRAYLRVVPAGWNGTRPSALDIDAPPANFLVDAPSEFASSGWHGITAQGAIRFWLTEAYQGQPFQTRNATSYFDQTGEFWMVHGTSVVDSKGQKFLANSAVLKYWSIALREANIALDHFGASATRYVEAGLAGVSDVRWGGDEWPLNNTLARRPLFATTRQHHDWGRQAQLTFLTQAYNDMRDLFALPRYSESELTDRLSKLDQLRGL